MGSGLPGARTITEIVGPSPLGERGKTPATARLRLKRSCFDLVSHNNLLAGLTGILFVYSYGQDHNFFDPARFF